MSFSVLMHINRKNNKSQKMGRAVPLEWAEESRIEKWAESSGPRSSGPKWFWAEMTWNRLNVCCTVDNIVAS